MCKCWNHIDCHLFLLWWGKSSMPSLGEGCWRRAGRYRAGSLSHGLPGLERGKGCKALPIATKGALGLSTSLEQKVTLSLFFAKSRNSSAHQNAKCAYFATWQIGAAAVSGERLSHALKSFAAPAHTL